MATRLTEAERRYAASIPRQGDSRRWRVTDDNRFWVRCCDLTSSIRFEDSASAQDAALDHMRTCPEARHG